MSKVLNIRSGKFYVEHLIHSLVLHAFAYLIYGLGISIMTFHFADFGNTIFICFLLVTHICLYIAIELTRAGLAQDAGQV
ncbi:hypothetical protein [Litoribacter populi]|uniref:hypothetical protein n=1 Tax=Litoribacter populi TaxID=2598460 RepID=UPI00117F89DA|nr:hypothetical protein [Litoribacter populi]